MRCQYQASGVIPLEYARFSLMQSVFKHLAQPEIGHHKPWSPLHMVVAGRWETESFLSAAHSGNWSNENAFTRRLLLVCWHIPPIDSWPIHRHWFLRSMSESFTFSLGDAKVASIGVGQVLYSTNSLQAAIRAGVRQSYSALEAHEAHGDGG
jgi:hypothetical protein